MPGTDVVAKMAFAQWIDRSTLVWDTPGTGSHALEYARDQAAGWRSLPLAPMPDGVPGRLRDRYPHLAASRAFEVPGVDRGTLDEALRSPLAATERDDAGRLVFATGVQLPGVLDDLFAPAVRERLGPTWAHGTPRLAVWAPTARSVTLLLYATPTGGEPRRIPMLRDDTTGTWSAAGEPGWRGAYYTYLVTVYAPSVGAVVTNEVTDPYSVSLAADSVRSHLVDLSDPALMPPGWTTLRKPPTVRPEAASIYELHVREFSAYDVTVPESLRGKYSAFPSTTPTGHMRCVSSPRTASPTCSSCRCSTSPPRVNGTPARRGPQRRSPPSPPRPNGSRNGSPPPRTWTTTTGVTTRRTTRSRKVRTPPTRTGPPGSGSSARRSRR
ncbi:hypothetical protein GCM10029964_056470 [Kibdelosporangium lantanae]